MTTELVKASDFSVVSYILFIYFYFLCYREVKSQREGRSSPADHLNTSLFCSKAFTLAGSYS